MADRIPANLSKIIEDPDGEANTSTVKSNNPRFPEKTEVTSSNRSSVVHRTAAAAAGTANYDNEYNGKNNKIPSM